MYYWVQANRKFSARLATTEEIKAGKIVIPEEQLEFCKYLSSQFFAGNSEELNDFILNMLQR